MKTLYCPICNRKLGTHDGKSTIDKVFKCNNCNKKIIYRIQTDKYEVSDINNNVTSSGKKFL